MNTQTINLDQIARIVELELRVNELQSKQSKLPSKPSKQSIIYDASTVDNFELNEVINQFRTSSIN